jgi:MAPEG family
LNHWKTVSSTSYALTGFVAWTLLLLLLMEGIRTFLVLTGRVAANGFTPENEGLSPFMQRFARAHANCIEGLPIFGGLLAIAIMTSRTAITDPLAFWLLEAEANPAARAVRRWIVHGLLMVRGSQEPIISM